MLEKVQRLRKLSQEIGELQDDIIQEMMEKGVDVERLLEPIEVVLAEAEGFENWETMYAVLSAFIPKNGSSVSSLNVSSQDGGGDGGSSKNKKKKKH